ncbi:MAG: transposase [Mycobacteriales bacterium]
MAGPSLRPRWPEPSNRPVYNRLISGVVSPDNGTPPNAGTRSRSTWFWSDVEELHRLGRTLDTWRGELLAGWTETGRRRVSNGPTEAVNALIKKAKRISVNRPSAAGLAQAA